MIFLFLLLNISSTSWSQNTFLNAKISKELFLETACCKFEIQKLTMDFGDIALTPKNSFRPISWDRPWPAPRLNSPFTHTYLYHTVFVHCREEGIFPDPQGWINHSHVPFPYCITLLVCITLQDCIRSLFTVHCIHSLTHTFSILFPNTV